MAGGIGGAIGSIIGGIVTGGAGPAIGAGIGAAIPSVAEIAKVIVDRTIPDPTQKAEAQREIEQALTARETALTAAVQAQNEQQAAINLAEAQGNDRFSSRWRPAAAWVCVAGLAYQYVVAPVVTWAGAIVGVALDVAFPAPPTLAMNDLWPILAGLLGLGFQRTYERTTGVPGAIPGAPQR
ncbi:MULTISPECIES: 3TM-type holin [Methylobacterium]|uniref:Holin of 3TMs, for gene-transfer release n=1 Tax=Methylobacterium jeotgali TaxID=381630 RepID=A0ABQ4SZU3_9HYPH|nr:MULTISPECIES: 3TM-type holin [Methylobacterium]PIU06891.1 MAG: hypothetical protein COT56_07090 [Methylobacterium sp. CG09_land_8_20_14_0_10_71_15]PIU16103.1 MAG: hypothetical protein COT28_01410 [Methylobacterium sp. CG08_land_8_20_14_0_20_71_15]GBU19364.1 hypothetical protein AwMethylo_35790 [Methylobacterium sp.]GJE08607.1 hypothetical protein AOPFMNJM_3950 [Methylobacterium jeotgali]